MKKGTAITFALGVFAGIALCGPAAQAATAALTATLSDQPIYVDGVRVELEAYEIHGNNFVKLRDIGEAVGFNVYWDGEAVQIESGKSYTGEAPVSQTTQPEQQSPAALTEVNVQATIRALRETYPSGTYYGNFYRSYSNGPYGSAPTHCSGWATLCSDAAFGDLPWQKVYNPNWEDIRPGDLIRFNTDASGHVVVVLAKYDEYISVTESSTNNKVLWGGQYFRWWLEEQSGYTCYTRYPTD